MHHRNIRRRVWAALRERPDMMKFQGLARLDCPAAQLAGLGHGGESCIINSFDIAAVGSCPAPGASFELCIAPAPVALARRQPLAARTMAHAAVGDGIEKFAQLAAAGALLSAHCSPRWKFLYCSICVR